MGVRVCAGIVLAALQRAGAGALGKVGGSPVAWLRVDEERAMKPRWVREPITGLAWIATSRGAYWLAWLPAVCTASAFALGYFVGRWR
jgi:hypothetical protein